MKRFKNILCAVGPEESSAPVLERAVSLAQNNQAALSVVAVVPRVSAGIGMPDGGPISNQLQAALVSEHTQVLESLIEPYRQRIEIQSEVLIGVPFLEIVQEVLRKRHDLVIKIPEQWDWLDRVFGSDDMHLLRKCPCPVWLIRPQAPKTYRRILAAVNVDEGNPPAELQGRYAMNRQILEMASTLALSEFSELHVVHVWDAIGESAMRGAFMNAPEEKIKAYTEHVRRQHEASLETMMREVYRNLGNDVLDYIKPKKHLIKGWARKEIPLLAKRIEADLIVMGTVARSGVPGFIMGNTAETILNQIDCSVLAIKPPGFISPITIQT